jgi:hypothetical protein
LEEKIPTHFKDIYLKGFLYNSSVGRKRGKHHEYEDVAIVKTVASHQPNGRGLSTAESRCCNRPDGGPLTSWMEEG